VTSVSDRSGEKNSDRTIDKGIDKGIEKGIEKERDSQRRPWCCQQQGVVVEERRLSAAKTMPRARGAQVQRNFSAACSLRRLQQQRLAMGCQPIALVLVPMQPQCGACSRWPVDCRWVRDVA